MNDEWVRPVGALRTRPFVMWPYCEPQGTDAVRLYTNWGFPLAPKMRYSRSASVNTQIAHHPLAIVLAATILVPFLVLLVEYVFRTDTGLDDTMRSSGPDLCLLGLGAVGSIFIDPKVVAAFVIPPQLGGSIVVLIIFLLRGVCFRLQKLPTTTRLAVGTMIVGLASIGIVGSILIYSYRS